MAGYPQDHIGPYEIRGKLGEGAMAVVWRGYDPNLEREVAIKEPKFNPNDSPERIAELGARFVKEGKTAAKLIHGNIVTIYAADVYDGRPAIVMELVEGRTLFDVLGYGALSPSVALDIADQLLDAVACAHSHGIVHRDIKPDNIFINASGTVKLADFGIAHIEDGSATHATMAGMVLGAPGYMSPEQAVGNPVDSRSDLFSIGVVIYEMLTGMNPFRRGDSANPTTILYRTVHEPAPELPDSACEGLPVDLRPAVESALSKNPADRPQTAWDFKAQLHGAPVPTRPIQPSTQTGTMSGYSSSPASPSRNYLPYVLVGIAGVAVIAVLVVFGLTSTSGGSGSVATNPQTTTTTTNTNTTETPTQTESTNSTTTTNDSTTPKASTTTNDSSKSNQANNTNTTYHIGVESDGRIGIYSGPIGKSATLVKLTDVTLDSIESYDSAEADRINQGIVVNSYEEAEKRISGYKTALKERTNTTAAAAAPATDNVQITVEGADGSVRTETIRRQGTSQRVFADSNTRALSEAEVSALSDAERCVAWNEIIAAETGYSFKNSGLANYFNNNCGSWYVSRGGSGGTDSLTEAGRNNVSLLKNYTSGWWKELASH